VSATLQSEPALASAGVPADQQTSKETEQSSMRGPGDRLVIAVLAACFAAITALTWRKWGVPELDAGAELTTADLVKHGALVYRDVRYYYGPLGLYSLALSFKIFGTSFTTAYIFGLGQAVAILAAFYALARQWLVPLTAGLSTALLLAIGFRHPPLLNQWEKLDHPRLAWAAVAVMIFILCFMPMPVMLR